MSESNVEVFAARSDRVPTKTKEALQCRSARCEIHKSREAAQHCCNVEKTKRRTGREGIFLTL